MRIKRNTARKQVWRCFLFECGNENALVKYDNPSHSSWSSLDTLRNEFLAQRGSLTPPRHNRGFRGSYPIINLGLYCGASAKCADWICSLPARSANVRASFTPCMASPAALTQSHVPIVGYSTGNEKLSRINGKRA
jgi:hypothetical protein